MNWSVLVVFAIISGLVLWLGAKFFGKRGLVYVAVLEIVLSLTLNFSNAFIFGVPITGVLIFMLTAMFVIFLFYKKYTLKDVTKLLILTGSALLVIGLSMAVCYMYVANLNSVWVVSLLPMIAILVSFGVAVTVGYLVDTNAKFVKDFTLRNLLSMACAVFSLILVYNLFALTGTVSFGNFLLSLLISFIVSAIYMLILIALDKFGLLVKTNELKNSVIESKQKSIKKEINLDNDD